MAHPYKTHYRLIKIIRVSTKEQDIDRQHSDIEYHIERFAELGFTIEIVETYALDGITGIVVQNRPEFKRMLETLKRPDIDGIILSMLDRFMRPEHVDAYGALKIFRVGKKLMFCDAARPLLITNPEDRTVIVTQLEASAAERRKIQYRTQRKKEELIKDPTVSVTRLPKGVIHIRDTKRYGAKTKKGWFEYTEYAIKHVKPAFERVAAGRESLSAIAASLGFSNETRLRDVLKNKWWIGINERVHTRPVDYDEETGAKIIGKRKEHPAPYRHFTNLAEAPPLVSVELFERVQSILAVKKDHFYQAQSNTGNFLGTNFLYCQCGQPMYLKFDDRRSQPPVYVCSSYQKRWRMKKYHGVELPVCNASRLRAEDTDKALEDVALQTMANMRFLRPLLDAAKQSDDAQQRRGELDMALKTVEDLEGQKRRAQKTYVRDNDEDAEKLLDEVKRDLAAAKLRLEVAKANAQPFGTQDGNLICELLKNRYASFPALSRIEQRAIFQDTLERISIDERGYVTFVVRGGLSLPAVEPNHERRDFINGILMNLNQNENANVPVSS